MKEPWEQYEEYLDGIADTDAGVGALVDYIFGEVAYLRDRIPKKYREGLDDLAENNEGFRRFLALIAWDWMVNQHSEDSSEKLAKILGAKPFDEWCGNEKARLSDAAWDAREHEKRDGGGQ